MPEAWEINYCLNPHFDDSLFDNDSDLLVNIKEFLHNTNPFQADTDNDGLTDFDEVNSVYESDEKQINSFSVGSQWFSSVASLDNNYLVVWYDDSSLDGSLYGVFARFYDPYGNTLGTEFQVNTYTLMQQFMPAVTTNGSNYFVVWESNLQDGSWGGVFGEFFKKSDPLHSDSDNDGLLDGDEIINHTDLFNPDTDGDLILDGYEVMFSLNPLLNDALDDNDNDGLNNLGEFQANSNPNILDTDGDGMDDGDEVKAGMEPDNADSLFAVVYCGYDDDINSVIIQWDGSVANAQIPYEILWRHDFESLWTKAVIRQGDIVNINGLRTWFDEGDNDSRSPRPRPQDINSRLYKVIVE